MYPLLDKGEYPWEGWQATIDYGSTRWKGHQKARALEHCHRLFLSRVRRLDGVDRDSLGCRLLRNLAHRVVLNESDEPYLLEELVHRHSQIRDRTATGGRR